VVLRLLVGSSCASVPDTPWYFGSLRTLADTQPKTLRRDELHARLARVGK